MRLHMRHPLAQAERVRDESAALRALQAALTMLQDPMFADDEVRGAGLGAVVGRR